MNNLDKYNVDIFNMWGTQYNLGYIKNTLNLPGTITQFSTWLFRNKET